MVLSSSIFQSQGAAGKRGILNSSYVTASGPFMAAGLGEGGGGSCYLLTGSAISSSADALRHRLLNISFNNTVELNSSIYFCRVRHNEFNYSSNPTYLTSSQIRVKNIPSDPPIAYITTLGLYSTDGRLLAVGKLSEPVRKDPNIELVFRARLDF